MIYPDFTRYLTEHLPGFLNERESTKRVIAKILWVSNRHYVYEGAIAITTSFLRDHLHTSQALFNKINSKYSFFTCGIHKHGDYSRPLYPNPIVTELTSGFAHDKRDVVLRVLDGDIDKLLRNAPEYFEIDGISVPFAVKFDMEALQHYMSVESNHRHIDEAGKFYRLCRSTYYEYGIAPQTYVKSSTGRIVGVGVSLQGAPRELRRALLNGTYDYDFKNCHYNILRQQDSDYLNIDYYCENTKSVRNTIINDVGITKEHAKKCLLALMYGATEGTYRKKAIPKLIGEAATILFWKHPLIRGLLEDVEVAGVDLIKRYGEIDGKDLPQTMGHHLQKIESTMLKTVGSQIQMDVLIFDGWIGSDVIVEPLEKLIVEETGYSMQISKEQLIYDY